jgi:putative membrane protein insertion efficiency factor
MSGVSPRTFTRAAAAVIRAYQLVLSPILGANCRFQPTCSEYAREALLRHGFRRGAALAAKRIARCHPWDGGGYDPVPSDSADPNTRANDALLP